GGQFMAGCYTEALFESAPVKIVPAGPRCIPADSQYAGMVRHMLRWHRQNPHDGHSNWAPAEMPHREAQRDQKASNGCIDVKINGAYVLMGLLYGQGDPGRTIIIACRCRQDSDCNPSSAAGVLFTSLGCARLPERYTESLDASRAFDHTEYT